MPAAKDNASIFQFPQVRVVEASAGSGKTYALAKRYVQLLLNPSLAQEEIPLRHILAITFTNKAALEMKERILTTLKSIALGALSPALERDIVGAISRDPAAVRQKAFVIMGYLIHNYNFFQVQTIDSFINALLSGCSFKIGLSANFRIKRNDLDYLGFSLDELIDQAGKDKAVMRLFEDFLDQYLFIENRTSWFPKKDILSLVATLFKETNSFGYGFKAFDAGKSDLSSVKKKILKSLKDLRDHVPGKTDQRFLKSLDSLLANNSRHFDIDDLSTYFYRETFPVNKGAEVPKPVEKSWDAVRAQLKSLCELEAFSLFNCYINVFNRVILNFESLTGKDDVLFLSELNKKARRLFDEEAITVEELYYRLATRFRHYLVDEFQDTSILQWRNLYLMVEEALSTGGSLFYVGDKKQAIYGFRGGEALLFDQIKERFQAFNVQTEILGKNFRSQKAVVEFNNHIFSDENLRRFLIAREQHADEKKDAVSLSDADCDEILSVFHDSRQTFREENTHGHVKVEFIDADKKEDLTPLIKEKLIAGIKDLKSRFAYRDIALLTRGNKEIELMTSWLLEEGIGVQSERTSNIKENFLIKELISFLKFLNSPIDNLAFCSFILGETFLKAASLSPETMRGFIFGIKSRMQKERDFYVYREFREKFPREWDRLIEEFFKNVGLFPLYELLVSMIDRFECLNNFPEYQGFIMKFLEVVKDEEEEHADIASFLEFFEEAQSEELYVDVADTDAVRILTIHKSKGLEFPVVLIPFLSMEVQAGSGGGQGERSYTTQLEGNHLRLLHLKKKYLGFSPELKAVYTQEYKKSFLSELNNVYVALTRAQKELYVFVPKKAGNSFNLANLLIPAEKQEWGERVKYPAAKDPARSKLFKLPPAEYEDWLHLLRDEFIDADAVQNRERVVHGDVLHFLLSSIGNLEGQDKAGQLKAAVEEAAYVFPSVSDFKGFRSIVSGLLEKESLKRFFYVKDGTVEQEKDVVDPAGHARRIDRLIVKKNEVWIIDYKSAREETGQYQEQVRDYMRIAEGLYPKRNIKGFLLYLDDGGVEEVAGLRT